MRKPIAQKREEADKRAQARKLRTIQAQLDLLASRPGKSKTEKKRLLDELLELQQTYHER